MVQICAAQCASWPLCSLLRMAARYVCLSLESHWETQSSKLLQSRLLSRRVSHQYPCMVRSRAMGSATNVKRKRGGVHARYATRSLLYPIAFLNDVDPLLAMQR